MSADPILASQLPTLQTCALIGIHTDLGRAEFNSKASTERSPLGVDHNAIDVYDFGTHGYWICTVVALGSFVILIVMGHGIAGVFSLLFYFMSAIGVRERSRYAAIMAFALYTMEMFL